MKKVFFLIFTIIINFSLNAQSTITDSLLKIVKTSKNNIEKTNALNSLFIHYEFDDTIKAKQYLISAFELANKINYVEGKAVSYTQFGFYYEDHGDFNKALHYYNLSLKEYTFLKESKVTSISLVGENGIAGCYINMGNAFIYLSNYPLALNNYQNALKIYEKIVLKQSGKIIKDKIASCNNNIGNIHFYQANYNLALNYYKKSLQINEETKNKNGVGQCYVNIGATLLQLHNDSLALEYENKALLIHNELGNKNDAANCYLNIGDIYLKWGKFNLAIDFFQKAYDISMEAGNKSMLSSVSGSLSTCYLKINKNKEAIEYAHKSLTIAKETGSLERQKAAYTNLSIAYEDIGKIKEALEYYKLERIFNDSTYNKEKLSQLSEMEAIYQNDKKEKEIELLNKNKILQDKEIEKQTLLRNSFIIGFILIFVIAVIILVFALIILRYYRQKRKINQILTIKNIEIEQQKEELLTQSEMLIETNTLLENRNLLITDSIRYAKQIQDAILPSEEFIKQYFQESFIFFKPKDIVSGDFYWFTTTEDYIFIAVVDCTGHGVPGAFMSMIGNTLLNQIIIQKGTYNPEKILTKLDEGVSYSLLNQGNKQHAQDDGMEISLCRIDKKNKELQIACTNQLAIVIKDNEFIEIENNIHSIGGSLSKNKSYKTQKINYNTEALVYLFTDGFQDQFGGSYNNKYLSKQIKELIASNKNKTISEQKTIFETSLKEWMGNNVQVDDITIVGIKI
ncbi:MAG: tetratricopeptide repeat protein [Bacteroidia bacterium]|nr:tetratricopeptide repeat protein [Bacteroidia bacterium]